MCNHDHSDVLKNLPALPMPTAKNQLLATTIVFRGSPLLGLDKPIQVFHNPAHVSPLRENGLSVVTAILVEDDTNQVVCTMTMDLPHDMQGASLVELPEEARTEAWKMVSESAVATLLGRVQNDALQVIVRRIIGESVSEETVKEWSLANIPPQDCDNPTTTGWGRLMSLWTAAKAGKTTFQMSTYGECVSHVMGDGWDEYNEWVAALKGEVTSEALMDSVPEYIQNKFGVAP